MHTLKSQISVTTKTSFKQTCCALANKYLNNALSFSLFNITWFGGS